MDPATFWIAVGSLVSVAGAIWSVFQHGRTRLDKVHATLDHDIEETKISLQQIRDTYVRRDDLMAHITRIEAGQNATQQSVERLRDRLDATLSQLIAISTTSHRLS